MLHKKKKKKVFVNEFVDVSYNLIIYNTIYLYYTCININIYIYIYTHTYSCRCDI